MIKEALKETASFTMALLGFALASIMFVVIVCFSTLIFGDEAGFAFGTIIGVVNAVFVLNLFADIAYRFFW